jgi:hypothetical protein
MRLVIYELHVWAFHDSDRDGIGDFRGLTTKLDYLQDLGVTALWLLPFCASPLKDDGYDIADYTSIHPHYGILRDFKVFLREAHRRRCRKLGALDGTVTVFRVTSIGQGDQAHDYFRHTALDEAVPVLWRRDTKLYT